jgi:thioredoxin-dependent peroxiredoxin
VTLTLGILTAAMGLFSSATLEVGQTAPDFTAKNTEGVELQLSKLTEKGIVILAFYPKAFTPG